MGGLIVNPRGTSRAGKTELVRQILRAHGWRRHGDGRPRGLVWSLPHPRGGRPVAVLGPYAASTAAGGCDRIRATDGGLDETLERWAQLIVRDTQRFTLCADPLLDGVDLVVGCTHRVLESDSQLAVGSIVHLYPHAFINVLVLVPILIWVIFLLYRGLPIMLGTGPERGMLMASALVAYLLVAWVSLIGITTALWRFGLGPVMGI